MIIPDMHKARMTVMKRRSPQGEDLAGPAPMQSEKVMSEDGEIDGRHVAAEDMMAAMGEKSPARLMEAMKNFIDLHNAKSETEKE
jgi:hypothetical protein